MIGAVVKTPFEASLRHDYQSITTSSLTPPSQLLVTEDVDLRMPLSYGMGLAWRASDTFTVDLDIYRTHWSEYILTDSLGNKFNPTDGQSEGASKIEDTTQVRIGGEYLFIFEEKNMVLPVRSGLFYDPEPTHGSVRNFYGFSFGSGVAYKRYILDLAYQLRWSHNVDTGNLIATSKANIVQHTVLASLIIHFN